MEVPQFLHIKMFFILLFTIIHTISGEVIRNKIDIVNNVSCPKSLNTWGMEFPIGKLRCMDGNKIFNGVEMKILNFGHWFRRTFTIINTYMLHEDDWVERPVNYRIKGIYLEIWPSPGHIFLLKGENTGLLFKSYGVDR